MFDDFSYKQNTKKIKKIKILTEIIFNNNNNNFNNFNYADKIKKYIYYVPVASIVILKLEAKQKRRQNPQDPSCLRELLHNDHHLSLVVELYFPPLLQASTLLIWNLLAGTDTFLIKKKGNLPPDRTIKKDNNHIYIYISIGTQLRSHVYRKMKGASRL